MAELAEGEGGSGGKGSSGGRLGGGGGKGFGGDGKGAGRPPGRPGSLFKTRVEPIVGVKPAEPGSLPAVGQPRIPVGTPDKPFELPNASIVNKDNVFTPREFVRTKRSVGMIDPNRIGTTQTGVGRAYRVKLPGESKARLMPLARLVEALRSGEIDPRQLEPITLYVKDGRIVTADHRRLVAARLAGVRVWYRLATSDEIRDAVIDKTDADLPIHQVKIRK